MSPSLPARVECCLFQVLGPQGLPANLCHGSGFWKEEDILDGGDTLMSPWCMFGRYRQVADRWCGCWLERYPMAGIMQSQEWYDIGGG